MTALRRAAAAAALVAGLMALAAPALAHPLGNFTTNRYVRVELSGARVEALYVVDRAEVPALEVGDAVARDPEGFAAREAAAVRTGLRADVDGSRLRWTVERSELTRPPGEGDLPTLRLALRLSAPLPAGAEPGEPARLSVRDTTAPDRLGWREVVVAARERARIVDATVPATDASDELRAYPADRLDRPLDVREATATFVPGDVQAPPPPLRRRDDAPSLQAGGGLAALVTRPAAGPAALALLLLLAAGFGAVHALGPGHGKTVMAAYLVGTRGRARDAIALGGVVAAMHTASVLAIGLGVLWAGRVVAAERLFGWLTVASGVAVSLVGAWLCRRRFRGHGTAHGRHDHDHDHGDGHAHGHDHRLPEGVAPLSRRGLVALATAGGLFPSPSALVVLLSAATFGRLPLGLALVGAFSVGLAATLAVVGVSLVYGREVVARSRHAPRLLGLLPRASAVALVVLGAAVTVQGLAAVR